MTKVLTIEKQPIIEEDLGLENTPVIQFRDEKEVWVTPIKLFKIADNLQQLRVTDFNKFSQGVVFGGAVGSVGNNSFYKWFPESVEPENLPDIVTSELSAVGRWIRQEIGSSGTVGNFVTTDTEQDIEPNALKNWLNFNKFSGYSTAGQVALIKDQNSQNLMLSLCETNEFNVNSHIGYPSRTSTTLEIFNELGGEVAFNRDIVLSDRDNPDLTQVAFIGFTANNRDNLIIKNEKSDKLYIANSIFGVDTNYLPKFSLSSNNTNLEVSNLDSGVIEFNADLNFSGGRKLINNVNTPVEIHQATPKDYVDTADENLQNQIDTNTQGIADANTRMDAIDDKILQLSGSSVVIGQITQTKDAVEVDRETILDAFVQQVKSRAPKEGDSVYTTDNYAYYRLSTAWSSPYTISINIANTTTAGLVLSTENIDTNRGKIYVNPISGAMNVIGDVVYTNIMQSITGLKTFQSQLVCNSGLQVNNAPIYATNVTANLGYTICDRLYVNGTTTLGSGAAVNIDVNGILTINGNAYYSRTPTDYTELTNKKYVDDAIAASGGGTGNSIQNNLANQKIQSPNNVEIRFLDSELAWVNFQTNCAMYFLSPVNSLSEKCAGIQFNNITQTNVNLYLEKGEQVLTCHIRTGLRNMFITTRSIQSDPEWEQDYATANYVNQKLQALYDHIDTRLKTIEQALNIPTTLANESRAIKAMIDEIVVPKSKVTTLYEELNSLQGYEGLLDMSTSEERKQIFSTTDRAEQLRILDEIKLRKEEAERQQAEMDKQQQQEQN